MLIKLRDIVLYSVLLKPEHWEGGQTDTKIYWWIWPSNSKQYKVHQKGIIFLKITYHQAISLMRFLKCWVSQWNLLNTWVKYTLYMCMGSNYPNEKKPIYITLKDFNHRSPKICPLIYLWHFVTLRPSIAFVIKSSNGGKLIRSPYQFPAGIARPHWTQSLTRTLINSDLFSFNRLHFWRQGLDWKCLWYIKSVGSF